MKLDPRLVHKIAQVCHEANRAYCDSIGDHSQPSWETAPEWQKVSAVAGVLAHLESELTLTPVGSHQSWMEQKAADGWVFGLVKDPEKKTHPCMIPYEELPLEQRSKDYIFRAIVHSMAVA